MVPDFTRCFHQVSNCINNIRSVIYPFFWVVTHQLRTADMWSMAVRTLWDIGWRCTYNYKKHFPVWAMGPTFQPLFNIHSSVNAKLSNPSVSVARLSDVLTPWLSTSIINMCAPITEAFKMVIHKWFAQNLSNFGDWHLTKRVCNFFFLPSDSMFRQFDSLHNAQNARRVTNESPLQVGELFSHCQTTNCTMSSQATIVIQRSQSRYLRSSPAGTFNWCHYHLSKSSIYIKLAHIRKELRTRLYSHTAAAWLHNDRCQPFISESLVLLMFTSFVWLVCRYLSLSFCPLWDVGEPQVVVALSEHDRSVKHNHPVLIADQLNNLYHMSRRWETNELWPIIHMIGLWGAKLGWPNKNSWCWVAVFI